MAARTGIRRKPVSSAHIKPEEKPKFTDSPNDHIEARTQESAPEKISLRTPRGTRRPVGSGNKLVAPLWAQRKAEKEGLVLRFVNDVGNEVESFKEGGYFALQVPEGEERFTGKKIAGDANP